MVNVGEIGKVLVYGGLLVAFLAGWYACVYDARVADWKVMKYYARQYKGAAKGVRDSAIATSFFGTLMWMCATGALVVSIMGIGGKMIPVILVLATGVIGLLTMITSSVIVHKYQYGEYGESGTQDSVSPYRLQSSRVYGDDSDYMDWSDHSVSWVTSQSRTTAQDAALTAWESTIMTRAMGAWKPSVGYKYESSPIVQYTTITAIVRSCIPDMSGITWTNVGSKDSCKKAKYPIHSEGCVGGWSEGFIESLLDDYCDEVYDADYSVSYGTCTAKCLKSYDEDCAKCIEKYQRKDSKKSIEMNAGGILIGNEFIVGLTFMAFLLCVVGAVLSLVFGGKGGKEKSGGGDGEAH